MAQEKAVLEQCRTDAQSCPAHAAHPIVTATREQATTVPLGSSEALSVGDSVIAVGSPMSLASSVTLGIVSALYQRIRTGRGQWVQSSLLHAMIAMCDFQAARYLIAGEVPPQAGNDHPTGIPTGVFRTADGHINIAASGQRMFRRLCKALALRRGRRRREALRRRRLP